jgi:hypothetical protein
VSASQCEIVLGISYKQASPVHYCLQFLLRYVFNCSCVEEVRNGIITRVSYIRVNR